MGRNLRSSFLDPAPIQTASILKLRLNLIQISITPAHISPQSPAKFQPNLPKFNQPHPKNFYYFNFLPAASPAHTELLMQPQFHSEIGILLYNITANYK